jgi:protein-S-isoprenylcysteine O-methyltransferase Ste14
MTDLRWAAAAALAATALVFLAGVRLAFRRPPGRHRYRASLVSGGVFLAEAVAIGLAPVPPGRLVVEAAILAVALALFAWAARVNRARPLPLAFAGQVPEQLQTRGPYSLVRHPFYASYLLAFAAGLVAAWTAWLLPVVAAGAFTYWRAARREEAGFEGSQLRDEYQAYARRVGMFVPRPWGLGRGASPL